MGVRNRFEKPGVHEILEEAKKRLSVEAPNYIIRQARREDIKSVIDINMVSLPEHYPDEFFYELFDRYGKAFYVAEDPEGRIVGYIMNRVEWKPGFFKHFIVRSGHVVSIAVLKEHRGRSLGYALMAYGIYSLKEEYNCEETYLEVRVSNTPAINLYRKLGYEVVKIARGYYLDGEDAYIMARPL
ncbi:GNAT family N-acetyltransferase [Thermogladius sp. 4427co]|uniref:GNAT family N-acetyltransferase n=1 Tax=Thermogladius sp. 4427co TaxID=3450718 RepID=UPI003F7A54C3